MRKIVFVACLVLLCGFKSRAQSIDSTAYYKHKCDSLQLVVKAKNFRLNRVKYYLSIVDKNPSQIKFLRGWLRRAVN